MIMICIHREGWLYCIFCDDGRVADNEQRNGGWTWEPCGGYEWSWEIRGTTCLIELGNVLSLHIHAWLELMPTISGIVHWLAHQILSSPSFSLCFPPSPHISHFLFLNYTSTEEHEVISSLCMFWYHDQELTPSIACTEYSIHPVQHAPSTAYTKYIIYQVQHTPSTAYTKYSIHQVQHTPSTAFMKYSIHNVLHSPCTALSQDWLSLAPNQSLICRQTTWFSIDHIPTIKSYPMNKVSAPVVPPPWTAASRLTVSKNFSNLGWSWPPSVSPNSIDHSH